jgi:F-type H+-transporting ATPase subunit alpha
MDDVPIADIKRFEKEVLEFIEVKYSDIFDLIKKEKQLSAELEEKMKKAADEFIGIFKKSTE